MKCVKLAYESFYNAAIRNKTSDDQLHGSINDMK